jgi:hypothetical protein
MILQQKLPTLFNVAIRLKLSGVTNHGIVLSIFLPFTKPSIPAKNVTSR